MGVEEETSEAGTTGNVATKSVKLLIVRLEFVFSYFSPVNVVPLLNKMIVK